MKSLAGIQTRKTMENTVDIINSNDRNAVCYLTRVCCLDVRLEMIIIKPVKGENSRDERAI